MTAEVLVKTFTHDEDQVDSKVVVFETGEKEAFDWLEAQGGLPGIGGVQFIVSSDYLEFHIYQQQKVWVATLATEEQQYGVPAVYVADTEEQAYAVVRKQNSVPDDVHMNDMNDWFQDRHMVLNIDSYYVE